MATIPPTVPGSPRTETVTYGRHGVVWGAIHARPRLALPDLDSLRDNPRVHRDGMLTVADAVLRADADGDRDLERLCTSPEHVRELAKVVEDQDLRLQELEAQLAIAQGAAERERKAAAEAGILRAAALSDANQQRAIAIRLSGENRALRLGGAAYLDLQAHVDCATRARSRACIDQLTDALDFDTIDLDTVVQDVSL